MIAGTKGKVVEAKALRGTRWQLPFTLLREGLSGWVVVDRYKTRAAACGAARRKGIKV